MQVLNFYHLNKTLPENAVYIGRAMPHLGLKGSKFANPYKISENQSREVVIQKYKEWLWKQIKSGQITLQELLDLEGYDLVCFCKQPNKEVACHGDVIMAAVSWARKEHDKRYPEFKDDYWNWEENYGT